eukprot:8501765-Pyramimonas_sp.AAC.1
MVVRGRETRAQTTTRPDHTLPEHWKTLSRGQQKKEIEYSEDIKQARETRERAALRVWSDRTNKPKFPHYYGWWTYVEYRGTPHYLRYGQRSCHS